MRPRLLDLFCGAGGAAMGYHRAGFDVVGVDIAPQPHYPFEFHQDDALALLASPYSPVGDFDVIHASPPCQRYSKITAQRADHPDLYAMVRAALTVTGRPWVIENVIGAPYRQGVMLCGSMFDLPLWRHRNFELSHWMLAPPCRHGEERPYTITGHAGGVDEGHHRPCAAADGPVIMGMPWATWTECVQAIPPAYTEWIGTQLLTHFAGNSHYVD